MNILKVVLRAGKIYNVPMNTILFCHDFPTLARTRAELWKTRGYKVIFCETAKESLQVIETSKQFQVAIFHQDLGKEYEESIGIGSV